MKLCPECKQEYTDETLNFCLEDGAWLVGRDVTEPATVIMSAPHVSSEGSAGDEAQTRAQIHTTVTDPQADGGGKRKIAPAAIVAALILIFILTGGYFTYRHLASSKSDGAIKSIAVMPFVNASGNAEVE